VCQITSSSKPATPKPVTGRNRVVIEQVQPELDCGRFPVKRVLGDRVKVEADVFADGHDQVCAFLVYRHEQEADWRSIPMTFWGNDHWCASFPVDQLGRYLFTVRGSVDRFATWRTDMRKRVDAGQDVSVELEIGARLLEQTALRAHGADAIRLSRQVQTLRQHHNMDTLAKAALDEEIAQIVARYPDPALESSYPQELSVLVDPVKARFSTWYELFPRSQAAVAGAHGTFLDCIQQLPRIARLGFDILYLPPVHPIGYSFRKGKNNAVAAMPEDVGSPWAIGSAEGGHMSVHPQLGTLEDFQQLISSARQYKIDIALDIALQCSPDHPWVKEHPEWFRQRPDGTIQYAENPPKKYQDIYPFDFESEDWQSLWDALRNIFFYWIGQGVRIFRVDNPHTKAFPFWEWVIGEIKQAYPEAIFLAEAFTRPRVMERLAKLGFSQSYTYFTWRNTPKELSRYLQDLVQTELREFLRPNFWPNTPDILPESLQIGGRAAFMVRLVLAGTLSSSYGLYGPAYELLENAPKEQGSEEYLNSEKYELKHWPLGKAVEMEELIQALNRARRENIALQSNENLHFHAVENPSLLCYSKSSTDGANIVICVVNLDFFHPQGGWLEFDLAALHLKEEEVFQVFDQLTGRRLLWRGRRNFLELDSKGVPAAVFTLLRKVRTERDFDYYQ
jgi:starch synthase (maltosyl-transferring)